MRDHTSALVVEDNAHMRFMLSQLLHTLEVEQVDAVSSIAEAQTHIDLVTYDFALVDVGLVNENGLDFIRSVRANPNHRARRMPMIVVSGQNQHGVVSKARDVGADSFIAKPVTTGALQARIQQVLGRRRSFVESPSYFGPDRRRGASSTYCGPERRGGAGYVDV